MARIGQTEIRRSKCKKHDSSLFVFVRPDAGDAFGADYACFHCAKEQGFDTDSKLTREQAIKLICQLRK